MVGAGGAGRGGKQSANAEAPTAKRSLKEGSMGDLVKSQERRQDGVERVARKELVFYVKCTK